MLRPDVRAEKAYLYPKSAAFRKSTYRLPALVDPDTKVALLDSALSCSSTNLEADCRLCMGRVNDFYYWLKEPGIRTFNALPDCSDEAIGRKHSLFSDTPKGAVASAKLTAWS